MLRLTNRTLKTSIQTFASRRNQVQKALLGDWETGTLIEFKPGETVSGDVGFVIPDHQDGHNRETVMLTKIKVNAEYNKLIAANPPPGHREQIAVTRKSFRNMDEGEKRLESVRVRFRRRASTGSAARHGTCEAKCVEGINETGLLNGISIEELETTPLKSSTTMYINSEYVCSIGGVMDEDAIIVAWKGTQYAIDLDKTIRRSHPPELLVPGNKVRCRLFMSNDKATSGTMFARDIESLDSDSDTGRPLFSGNIMTPECLNQLYG